jgi:carnitine 3-dehydrogenase
VIQTRPSRSSSEPIDKPIRCIAVVGTGVIGASWAMYFLSRGFDVAATDPAVNAEANLRKYVHDAWPALTRAGLADGASRDRLTFTPSLGRALAEADFVQENAPERPEFKTRLFAEMDEIAPADSILASSSSGITMDVLQSSCKYPERCVIGHPFNPPQIIPWLKWWAGRSLPRRQSGGP